MPTGFSLTLYAESTYRAEPIVLKVLMIMLCCTAQKCVNYAHEIVQLCSKMCLTDTGLILTVHTNGRSDCGR